MFSLTNLDHPLSHPHIKGATRGIQGRFNDLGLILASHAAVDEDGQIIPEAKKALDDIARIQRVLHILYWSTIVKLYNSLHSPEGVMSRAI